MPGAELTTNRRHRHRWEMQALRQLGDGDVDRALAAAELAQLTVLHIDKDYDLIAGITGQPVERLGQR
jgi:hypothetical protein